jgi:hypothetical protein
MVIRLGWSIIALLPASLPLKRWMTAETAENAEVRGRILVISTLYPF